MPRIRGANNAVFELKEAITASQDSFEFIGDSSLLPDLEDGQVIRFSIDGEIMEAATIDKTNNIFSNVRRELDDDDFTPAVPHEAGAKIYVRFTAGAHQEMVDRTEFDRIRVFTSVLGL